MIGSLPRGRWAAAALLLALLVCLCTPLQAGIITTFTDRSTWQAATSGRGEAAVGAVLSGNFLHDRQAEPGARGLRARHPEEALAQASKCIRRHAGAGILHLQQHATLRRQGHAHGGACILSRIA